MEQKAKDESKYFLAKILDKTEKEAVSNIHYNFIEICINYRLQGETMWTILLYAIIRTINSIRFLHKLYQNIFIYFAI